MNWLSLQSVAQVSIERMVNSLPEGVLIALSAWLLLRVTGRVAGRQNAGTRFAVWFTALLAVAGMPLLSGLAAGSAQAAAISGHLPRLAVPHFMAVAHFTVPHITVPHQWAVAVLGLWAVAAGAAMVRLGVGLWQVRAIRRSASETGPELFEREQVDPAVRAVIEAVNVGGAARRVTVAVSDAVRVPAAIGFLKPMIVLPGWALRDLSAEELKTILLHEHAHLERRDDWTNLLQKAVRAVFFFHPAVWWIDAKLSIEREMACDDAVLEKTGNPRAYAGCLIALLEKSCARRGWAMAQAAVGRAREASLRIAQILDERRPRTTRVWKPALGFAGALSLAGFGVLLCAPRLVVFGPAQGVESAVSSYGDAMASGALPKGAVVRASLRSSEPLQSREPLAVNAAVRRASAMKTATVKARKPAPAVAQRVLMADAEKVQPVVPGGAESVVRESVVSERLASAEVSREMSTGMTLVRETWMEETPASAVTVANGRSGKAGDAVVRNVKDTERNGVVLVRTAEYVETDAAGQPVRMWRVVLIQRGMAEDLMASVI